MIRSIFAERYKKVLLAACLLVIGVGVFNVVIENNQWKSVYNDPHGKENFEKHRHEITYWDDEKEDNVPFSSYKEYQNAQLIFYRSYESYPKIVTASDYSKAVPYQSNFATYFNSALLLIVPLMGFLLFFVDQKTGFNQFLFSLGTSRKDLFRKKNTVCRRAFSASHTGWSVSIRATDPYIDSSALYECHARTIIYIRP